MDRTKAIAIAVVVVIALGAIFYIPQVLNQGNTQMTITFFDGDGNEVYKTSTTGTNPTISAAFATKEGVEVSSCVVDLSYTVSGHSAQSTVGVVAAGEIVCRLNTMTGGIVKTTTDSHSKSTASGSWSITYNLDDLIIVDSAGQSNGWGLTFGYDLTVTEHLADETQKTASTVLTKTLTLNWIESALAITGEIGFA